MYTKIIDFLGFYPSLLTDAAGIIPVIEALQGKATAVGTVLAFIMSAIALSLPEMIIQRKVLRLKPVAISVAVVGMGHPHRRSIQPTFLRRIIR